MSLYLLEILCGLQHSGQAGTRPLCSPARGLCLVPTEGINCDGTACEKLSTACFTSVSFSICGSRCRGGIYLSLREQSSGNSLNVSSFCFYCEGLGSGVRTTRENRNLYLINQALRKERIVQNLLLSPSSLCLISLSLSILYDFTITAGAIIILLDFRG